MMRFGVNWVVVSATPLGYRHVSLRSTKSITTPKTHLQDADYLPERHLTTSRCIGCAKSVPESDSVTVLVLSLSEKQIPQFVENTEKPK
jgi:hypothetical protein